MFLKKEKGSGRMFKKLLSKCFKVSELDQRDLVESVDGDVVYVRKHPNVYMKEDGEWITFTKIYAESGHPKQNLEDINDGRLVFKIDSTKDLEDVPAKDGDLIYRTGDVFMYIKHISKDGMSTYGQITKI